MKKALAWLIPFRCAKKREKAIFSMVGCHTTVLMATARSGEKGSSELSLYRISDACLAGTALRLQVATGIEPKKFENDFSGKSNE